MDSHSSIDGLEHLDEAMDGLPVTDRNAVLLRFYSGRSFPEMGAVLGCSEEAARKLCTRAVRKLGVLLERRGVVLPATGLAVLLPVHWFSLKAAVPPGLSASIAEGIARQIGLTNATASSSLISLSAMKFSSAQ